MRKILYAAGAILALASCHQFSSGTKSGSFTISGHISGMHSGQLLLSHASSGNTMVHDTLQVSQGNFSYSNQAAAPSAYYLSLLSGAGDQLTIFVDSGGTIIEGASDSLAEASVEGSATETAYQDYRIRMKPFRTLNDSLDRSYEAAEKAGNTRALDSLNNQYDSIENEQQSAIAAYVRSHPGSVVGAWAVTRNFLYNPDIPVLSGLYQSMDSSVRNSTYGRLIDTSLVIAKRVAPGQTAPDFTQDDTAGNPFSLSALRGKYVLVDFWASWCGPCRAENPNVVKAFNRFRGKGFTVLGVSLDKSRKSWLNAIHQDHLYWNQVSDLKFWNNQVARQYGIRAIPSNFLLDRDGKILARNLRGKKLDQELVSVFR